jgi:hypothetical protein
MQLLLDADADAWKTLDDAITENPAHADEVLKAAATAIPTAERNADKATAFAIGLRLIDHLIAPPTAQRLGQAAPTESPEALPPPRPGHPTPGDAIHALFVGLLKNRPSDDLLRDLAHEVKALSAALAPTADAVLLTLDYLAQDRSPAVLERAEPDIAIAVRALVEALDAEAGEPGP